MTMQRLVRRSALLLACAASATLAQRPAPPAPAPLPPPPYADVADLVLKSPVIAEATVRSVKRLKREEAIGVPAGKVRLLVTADVTALLRGPDVLPPRISYLLDVNPDSKGKIPDFRKQPVMLYARTVAGQPNQLQLVGDGAQRMLYPALDERTRKVIAEVISPSAPPVVTGVGNAFHVPGALPGEGETQVFLLTADNRPVSISVLSRPGEQKRWAVALSEIVDEAAGPPAPDTLLWYRLACFLPRALPDRSLANGDESTAPLARADYQFVLKALGPCRRSPPAG